MKNINFKYHAFLFLFLTCKTDSVSREKRYIAFPKTSSMGIFLAVAVPVGSAKNNLFLAYNFEASYDLPINETVEDGVELYTVDVEEARSKLEFNRTIAYKLLESKIETHGYPGQECLLRTICELSASSIDHNGVLGEILNVVFSPSTSQDEKLPEVYSRAEKDGKIYGVCEKYNAMCKISFLDLVSWLGI